MVLFAITVTNLAPAVFPMSKVWLTGRISRRRMIEEHPLEYEEIVRRRGGKY